VTTAHEPRRGPDIHPSTEDLSALAEGAEPGAGGVAAHLQDCAACRAEVDAIAELLTAFAELDAPALPQEVAIRIDAALVRESMARAARPGDYAVSSEAVSRETASDNAVPDNTVLADAASDSAGTTRSPSSSNVGVSATDSTRHPRPPVRGSRRARWRGFGWGLASLVLVAGGVTLAFDLTSSSAGSSASTSSGAAALSPSRESAGPLAQRQLAAPGTMIAAAPLVQLVKEILPTRTGSKSQTYTRATADSGCLADPRFVKYQQLASANSTYQGSAATLVIYENGSDSASVYAVAYATPCSTSNYHVLAEGIVSY
jgi:hypothetical protein